MVPAVTIVQRSDQNQRSDSNRGANARFPSRKSPRKKGSEVQGPAWLTDMHAWFPCASSWTLDPEPLVGRNFPLLLMSALMDSHHTRYLKGSHIVASMYRPEQLRKLHRP